MRYLYPIYAVFTFSLFFLILFPFFLLFLFVGKKGKTVNWYLIKGWGYVWFWLIGNQVKRIFLERPKKDTYYVVVANHHSYLDTAMIFRTIPFQVSPLATKELAKIPLFGLLYKQMAILVDRSDAKSKAKSVHLLKKTLKKECGIFIFPEGSFNETGELLKPFFDGAFRIALQTHTPILPVIFPDTADRFHYSSFWRWSRGKNRAIFLPAISAEEYHNMDLAQLKNRVFQEMYAALEFYGKKSS